MVKKKKSTFFRGCHQLFHFHKINPDTNALKLFHIFTRSSRSPYIINIFPRCSRYIDIYKVLKVTKLFRKYHWKFIFSRLLIHSPRIQNILRISRYTLGSNKVCLCGSSGTEAYLYVPSRYCPAASCFERSRIRVTCILRMNIFHPSQAETLKLFLIQVTMSLLLSRRRFAVAIGKSTTCFSFYIATAFRI